MVWISRTAALGAAVCGLCSGGNAHAQFTLPEGRCARSVSGQFIVRETGSAGERGTGMNLSPSRDFIRMDPMFLAVSCERIKQLLLADLAAPAAWQGKIFLALGGSGDSERSIMVTAAQFSDGWQYQIALPEQVHRGRFVRALVQVLLLEMANRTAESRSAEIPIWLAEGFAQHLLASSEVEIILPVPQQSASGLSFQAAVFNARRSDPLASAREQLRKRPLTFEELSWPAEEALNGEAGEGYRRSAQVFVNELLQLPTGRACLRAMLAELPQRQNWQLAFLDAFHGYFQQPLDIEKWWALHQAHFTGRELAQTWSLSESCRKLDEALRTPVQIRAGTNELPLHSAVNLQTIIREWDRGPQIAVLKAKAHELQLLQLRMAPALSSLVSDYIQALTAYLEGSGKIASWIPLWRDARQQHATDQILGQLDALDTQRRDSQPLPPPVAAAGATDGQNLRRP